MKQETTTKEGQTMIINTATRDGTEQYVIGRNDRQCGNNRPWIGKTWAPIPAQPGEVAAALVWDRELNGYPGSATSRWAVVARQATQAEAAQYN